MPVHNHKIHRWLLVLFFCTTLHAAEDGAEFTELFGLIVSDKIDDFKAALRNGARSDAIDELGRTALMVVAGFKKQKFVEALLECGSDVAIDAQDNHGMTALMHASLMSHPEIAKLLVQAGVDVRRATKEGGTALTMALYKQEGQCWTYGQGEDSKKVARLLVASGADIPENATDEVKRELKAIETRRHGMVHRFFASQAQLPGDIECGITSFLWKSDHTLQAYQATTGVSSSKKGHYC